MELVQPAIRRIDRARLLKLTEDEFALIEHDWEVWARPNQLPPLGDWRYWLVMSGRGFGKTRLGAEWVRKLVKKYKYVNLIGATADNARDIMVLGESGVMAVCPKGERPIYLKGERKLKWPNGAESLIFTAQEPERLRGPQHNALWCDELACVIAGSLVATERGDVPIEQVRVGERVQTRIGLRTVCAAWKSSDSAEVYRLTVANGVELIGTGNHPVFVHGRGFVPMAGLYPGDELCPIQSLSGAASVGISGRTTTRTGPDNYSIARNTWTRMARWLQTSMSTIATRIRATTSWTISSLFPDPIICANTARAGSLRGPSSNTQAAARASGRRSSQRHASVSTAVLDSHRLRHERNSAADDARKLIGAGRIPVTTRVIALERLNQSQAVFNLSVDEAEEYFANGILVHNSWNYPQETWDMAMFGLRLGASPQALVTTTPRPIPIVRELLKDPATVVTRGSTYENQANLAPSFFSQIIRKYEGTRLGRQELNAELLEDNPNALWMRARIDQLRVKLAPPLKRIVVAIDVAVTSGESSSHTGIVVAGIGEDNHGYILADLSIQASPDEWGQIAVDAYRQHQADRIIGEVNNGGDLVESLLRTIDRNISYKAVRASRGKTTRAEPIAALYEQGRVHHVGCLPQLEDEMVNYDPSPDSKQDSPDRMDALVWALHELFIEEPAEGGNVFSSPWRQWKADDLPKCAQVIQSVATEVHEENVQWAVTTWGVFIPLHSLPRVNVKIEPQDKKPSVILLAHEGATGSMEQAVKGIRQQYEKYKPDFLVVASQPGTKPVVRHLWRERLNVKRLKYDDAAGPQIGAEMLSAGMAWAPKKEWAKHVAQEVARYPYAERKVTVHSVALALVWLRHMGDVHPVFDPDEPPPPKSPEQYKPVYG